MWGDGNGTHEDAPLVGILGCGRRFTFSPTWEAARPCQRPGVTFAEAIQKPPFGAIHPRRALGWVEEARGQGTGSGKDGKCQRDRLLQEIGLFKPTVCGDWQGELGGECAKGTTRRSGEGGGSIEGETPTRTIRRFESAPHRGRGPTPMDVDRDRVLPRRSGSVGSAGGAVTTRGPTPMVLDRDRTLPGGRAA